MTAPYQIEYQDAAIPAIGNGEVLLKIICVGVCGSDSQIYHGKHKYRNEFPREMGHEVAAVLRGGTSTCRITAWATGYG